MGDVSDQWRAWLSAIQRAADGAMKVHLTFNNNHANYATTNALKMQQLRAGAA
ncbi:MAG: DUF72 domain-containing protein [Gemmatimonadaceae bacterium]|nr:DUF72 domain-containing protein [Gemmatimonadaceae bacterium]